MAMTTDEAIALIQSETSSPFTLTGIAGTVTTAAIGKAPELQQLLNDYLTHKGVLSEAEEARLMDALAEERRRTDARRAKRTQLTVILVIGGIMAAGAYFIINKTK